jgi:hypothetical protein
MVADPIATAVTCGCVAGVVLPAAINTLAGIVTLVVSLLARLTVTPPAGAACDRLTANVGDRPSPRVVVAGTLIDGGGMTVTLAVALGMPVTLAVIVTGPPTATPVTVTGTLVAPAAKLTVAGTVALLVSLELRLTVKPLAGACPPARFSVRVPVLPTTIDNGDPVKFSVADTVTVPVPDV